jgi:STE24 endopeptidase
MKIDPQVQAETARYIDSLGPGALQKAHDYTVGKEWMLLWALLVAAVVTWLIVRSGVFWTNSTASSPKRRRNVRALVVSFVFFLISTVLTLPWDALSPTTSAKRPTAGQASRLATG